MPSFNCSAILFDLDGVLVDSTRAVQRTWKIWAAEHGIELSAIMEVAHGRKTAEVVRLVAPNLDAESEAVTIEAREASDTEGVVATPGAREFVISIPDGRWGVVTSGTRLLASSRLKLVNIPIPKVLVTGGDVENGKPHPEPYLKGANMLGMKPEECVVFEDALAGVISAQAAAAKVIALAGTYPVDELSRADAVVGSFLDVRIHSGATLRLDW